MTAATLATYWPHILVAIVVWFTTLNILRVLGAYTGAAVRTHNLIRESQLMRIAYLNSIAIDDEPEAEDEPVAEAVNPLRPSDDGEADDEIADDMKIAA